MNATIIEYILQKSPALKCRLKLNYGKDKVTIINFNSTMKTSLKLDYLYLSLLSQSLSSKACKQKNSGRSNVPIWLESYAKKDLWDYI